MKNFLKRGGILSAGIGLFCLFAAVNSALQSLWGYAAVNSIFALLNIRLALPPEYRWPKKIFPS